MHLSENVGKTNDKRSDSLQIYRKENSEKKKLSFDVNSSTFTCKFLFLVKAVIGF